MSQEGGTQAQQNVPNATAPAVPLVNDTTTREGGSSLKPPRFESSTNYESWKKEIKLWQLCCRLKKDQQGPALALSLQGKAKEAVLELEVEELASNDGVKLLLEKLDGLYKKDENQMIYMSLKSYEQHVRQKNQTIDDYINEFERRYNKLKTYGIIYPDTAVAYRLLEGANVTEESNKLVRTTVPTFDFKSTKAQLRKLEDSAANCSQVSDVKVKTEPAEDTFYGQEQRCESREQPNYNNDVFYNQEHYGNGRQRERGNGGVRLGRGAVRGGRGGRGGRTGRGGRFGGRSRARGSCFICKSFEHYANECPVNRNNYNGNNNNNPNGNIEEGLWNEQCVDLEPIEIVL